MKLNAATLKEGIEKFHEPRHPDDVDLVQLTRDALVNFEMEAEQISVYDADPLILQAKSQRPPIQRHQLNRFWTQQLMQYEAEFKVSTMNIRYYLLHDGPIESWLRLFTTTVLPFVIRNKLMKPIPLA